MFENVMGKRSIAQMRKMQDGLIIILNETDGSSTVVKNILQGDSTLQLDHSITTQANFPLVVCRWVIRRMKTQLSDKDILEQIQNENNTRKASGAAECTIGRTSTTISIAVKTLEGQVILNSIQLDKKQ